MLVNRSLTRFCRFSSSFHGLPSEATTSQVLASDAKHLWHPYTAATKPNPHMLVVDRAEGCTLHLEDGRALVDGMASWWCAIHGYRVPELDDAAHKQISKMSHVMFGGLTHRPAVHLAELLVSATPEPLQRVFLCDSGSVAIEVALKMALQYWRARGVEGRTKMLTVRGGYHGDTFGAMAVCDPDNGMHAAMFAGCLKEHVFAPRPSPGFHEVCTDTDVTEIEAFMNGPQGTSIAAVILEPIVQGAGGMRFHSPGFLKRVRALCDKHGMLLIFDEIATGFGRTGKLFACEHADVCPDIICVGKALTGGYMTLGATLATEAVAAGVSGGFIADDHGSMKDSNNATPSNPTPLMHGPTFMGNPLACAVAAASLELLFKGPWKARVNSIEQQLTLGLAPLKNSPAVKDVRVLGAIGVVELEHNVDVPRAQALLADHGVWLRPFGKLLYTMPPFVIEPSELNQIIQGMEAVVHDAEKFEA